MSPSSNLCNYIVQNQVEYMTTWVPSAYPGGGGVIKTDSGYLTFQALERRKEKYEL